MSTRTLFSPIVGTSFRPASARQLLSSLSVGQPLVLEPEPDNPHDPEAIRVCVSFWALTDAASLIVSASDSSSLGDLIHLGYIPKSGGKFDTTGTGNHQVLSVLQSGPNWSAALTFSPEGFPLVQITTQTQGESQS